MGAYLSEPMTNKESEDGDGNRLKFGASTMQGWRAFQEDAHNCVAEFDGNSSLFGVYDGHGGAEVAIYVAKHFPDLLKSTEAYADGDIEKAFIEAYLKIDASIKEEEVLKEIQELAKKGNGNDSGEAGIDYEEENVNELYEEATMPLEKLVAKYQKKGTENATEEESESEKPGSSKDFGGSSGSSSAAVGSSSSSSSSARLPKIEPPASNHEISPEEVTSTSATISNEESVGSASSKANGDVNTDANLKVEDAETKVETTNKNKTESVKSEDSQNGANGEIEKDLTEEKDMDRESGIDVQSQSQTRAANGNDSAETSSSPSKPRKKIHPVAVPISDTEKVTRLVRKAALAMAKAFPGDGDSSDFDSSDEDDSEDLGEESSDEDSDADSDAEDDDEEEADDAFLNGLQEPGFDSGTTAVVSLLRWNGDKLHLYVANAGDSRCVVSKNGTAVDMSYDHKPESEEETLRIIRAGGKVTEDGRVNGGLNLSRALGDHSYKQNVDLPPKDQMISPLPSIQHLELNPQEDEFVVLACDGVWNSMTSQEVVDFVKERISTAPSLSKICEELFDTCLSESTVGDGTGCDNMTAIIVQIPRPSTKRSLQEADIECEISEDSLKRQKVDAE